MLPREFSLPLIFLSLWACVFTFAAVADSNMGFLLAVRSNKSDAVRSALAQGADVNRADKDGYTALMFAVMYGFKDKEIVDLLLTHDAQVNTQASNGMTALMLAAGAGSGGAELDIVDALLDHGADPLLKNKFGMTALMYAESAQRLDVAKLLQSHGAVHEGLPRSHELTPITDNLMPAKTVTGPAPAERWKGGDVSQFYSY